MLMDRSMIFLVLGILLFGCTGPTEGVGAEDIDTPAADSCDGGCYTGEPAPPMEVTPGETSDRKVLMLGRSVTYAWMEDYMGIPWECFDEECGEGTLAGPYHGHNFVYTEIDPPPGVVASAVNGLDNYYGEDAGYVFFKLCFVDFEPDESGELLERNKRVVQDIYHEVVVVREKKLIIGNALPMVEMHNDPLIVSDHLAYNAWLEDFAAADDNVKVLDLYGTLSDSNGALKSEYAVSESDSHLNHEAYAQITPQLMALLDNA